MGPKESEMVSLTSAEIHIEYESCPARVYAKVYSEENSSVARARILHIEDEKERTPRARIEDEKVEFVYNSWFSFISQLEKETSTTKSNLASGKSYFMGEMLRALNDVESYISRSIVLKGLRFIKFLANPSRLEFWGDSSVLKYSFDHVLFNINRILYRVIGERILNKVGLKRNIIITNICQCRHSRAKWTYWDFPFPFNKNGFECITQKLGSESLLKSILRYKDQKMVAGGAKKRLLFGKTGQMSKGAENDVLEKEGQRGNQRYFKPGSACTTIR